MYQFSERKVIEVTTQWVTAENTLFSYLKLIPPFPCSFNGGAVCHCYFQSSWANPADLPFGMTPSQCQPVTLNCLKLQYPSCSGSIDGRRRAHDVSLHLECKVQEDRRD